MYTIFLNIEEEIRRSNIMNIIKFYSFFFKIDLLIMFEACKTSNIVISLDKKLGSVVITRHMKTKKYSFVSPEFQNSDAFIIHQIT